MSALDKVGGGLAGARTTIELPVVEKKRVVALIWI
jgi:hypothetical protein